MDIIATRSTDTTEAYKTTGTSWSGSFTTEAGGEVDVLMKTVSQEPVTHGTLGPAKIIVEVGYADTKQYFGGAPCLYPYISILKTKYLNQGTALLAVDGAMRQMDQGADGTYRATFTAHLDNSISLHQEILAGLTMAFTSVFPHSGQAPWDSNGHKNHGFWVR